MTVTKQKVYTLSHWINGEYGHYQIVATSKWSDSEYINLSPLFQAQWQYNVTHDDNYPHLDLPYAGEFTIDQNNIAEAAKVITKANQKAEQLAGDFADQMHKFLVGLRAIGFKEAKVFSDDISKVYAVV